MMPGKNYWETTVSSTDDAGKGISWFLGGTAPGSGSVPLALALVLEDDNPGLAEEIGGQILEASIP